MAARNCVKKQKGDRVKLSSWERLQLGRLACSLVLFLAVFLGKKIYPAKMMAVGEDVVAVLGRSMELEAVFEKLGGSITGEGALKGLEQFCLEVFGAGSGEDVPQTEDTMVFRPRSPEAHAGLLDQELDKLFDPEPEPVVETEEENSQIPAVGTVLRAGPETETELPRGCTMDELSFGALETVSPVLGHLNSGFGYREHPVNGENDFHSGADISASEGDPILSFADGVVEYIGQDNTYGLYMQIDHGNEIKSFYAHCSRVCVKYGQRVKAGETVARVGSTGRVTGPHLHLELKCCGKRVDPAYYVEFI